jgi:glutamine synthetase adenylyltransferase
LETACVRIREIFSPVQRPEVRFGRGAGKAHGKELNFWLDIDLMFMEATERPTGPH